MIRRARLLAGALALAALPGVAAAQSCEAAAPIAAGTWEKVEQQIRQNYAYIGRSGDADALFDRAEQAAASTRTTGDFAKVVNSLGYAFRDGHFHAQPVSTPVAAWIPSAADLWADLADDGRYRIVDVRRGSQAHALGVRPGWEVMAIDGRAVASAVDALFEPVLQHPDAAQRAYGANVLLAGFLNTPRRIAFRTPAGERTIALPAAYASVASTPVEPFTVTRQGEVAVVRFNNKLGDNAAIAAFDAAMVDLASARAIVLDLRNTPSGGNTTVARGIMGHFLREPRAYQMHRNAYEEAVFGVPRQWVEYVLPREKPFAGRLVVLGGRWTGSVGEAVMIGLDAAADAHSIGTELAGLLGTLQTMDLGGSCAKLEFAWDRLFHVDGTPREDWRPRDRLAAGEVGPDGGDPALARAFAYLEGVGITTR